MNDASSGEPLDTEPRTDWRRVRSMSDLEIRAALTADPDIAPTDEAFWEGARLIEPRRQETVALPIDADVLDWFRRQKGYQSRINSILRVYMNAEQPGTNPAAPDSAPD